uniref:BTB domain-containing protein n=1 Tax=Capitella teleta TaxID=283909 RepID=X2AIS7_CAPTE
MTCFYFGKKTLQQLYTKCQHVLRLIQPMKMDFHKQKLLASLRKMKENDVMTDITLILPDDSTISCHKLVLVAASLFFETMFDSGMKESIDKNIKLEFSDADTIRKLVEFIYSGEIDVNEDNVQTLVAASDFLLMGDLKAHCEDFLTTLIRSSNHQELCTFENEDIVFTSVVRWVNVDPEQRKEAFPRIAPFIRFPLCTQKTLSMNVIWEPLMWNPECFKLIAEAQHSQFHSRREPIENSRTAHRSSKREYLVRLSADYNQVSIEYTDSIDEDEVEWECKLLDFTHSLNKNNCIPSESGVIWIINDETRMSLDLKSYKISSHPWVKPRNEECSLFVGDAKIIAFGGKERLNPNSNPAAHVIYLLGNVYILGGYALCRERDYYGITMGNQEPRYRPQPSQSTQKFSIATQTWSLCTSMPDECTSAQAVALNDKIYVVGGENRICFCYDPEEDTWTVLSRPKFGNSDSATVWKGNILLSSSRGHSTLQVYDPILDCWKCTENVFLDETKQHQTKLFCAMRF